MADQLDPKAQALKNKHDIESLAMRVSALETAKEQARQERHAEMETELARYKASEQHWVRYVVTAIVTLVSGGLLLYVGKVLGGK